MKKNKIFIGTRGSKLAIYQSEWVKSELQKLYPGLEIQLIKIKTTGDRILDVSLAKIGGKGLFVKEIEDALLKSKVDIAVHSMKDVPTDLPEGLHIAAICKREDPRDAFVSQVKNLEFKIKNFKELPHGTTIGTSSLRRSCQLSHSRPDLKIKQLRGNLDTRIRKLDEGQFQAIIVAVAGMKRLGRNERITEILDPDICLPAIGQGAIGIECRIDNESINNMVKVLDHKETSLSVMAERSFLKRLEGGCQVPIAAFARIVSNPPAPPLTPLCPPLLRGELKGGRGGLLIMDGIVGSITGDRIIKGHIEGKSEVSEVLGIKLAEDLLARGAKAILSEVYQVSRGSCI
jgi:hydroxymethylbilane synthase